MSTETATLSLTAGVAAFLNALARGAEGGVLEFHARSPMGYGYENKRLTIPRDGWIHLPPVAIDLLEAGWGVHLGAAARQPGAGAEFLSLSALFTTHMIPVDFKPAPGESWRWRRDQAAAVDVLRRLNKFPLAPAFMLDGFKEIVALWPLVAPIRALEDARRLQRRLAEALGAATQQVAMSIPSLMHGGGHAHVVEYPADDPLAILPWPGSIVRDLGSPPPVVIFAAIAPDHIYSTAQIEAAIGPKGDSR